MAIDYEVEYNNRARVPEHPEIFARWERDGAAFRVAARNAELRVSYGPSQRQALDIFPAGGPNAPIALFIHGGWWRSLDPAFFSQLAGGPNAHGVTVAVTGYDLCPTCAIADIVEQMRAACLFLWRKYRRRIFVFGHSAGGHLAACLVATDWRTLAPDAPADLVPAAYAISGVFDLAPLVPITPNADLKLTEKSAHDLSPLYWPVPAGRALDAVVGGLESSEFLRQSHIIVDGWAARGVATRYDEIAGTNHFTVVDPLGDPNSAMTKRVAELAKQIAAMPL